MIRMTFVDGLWLPRFACDGCGGLIDDARDAHVLFGVPLALTTTSDWATMQLAPLFHVHKGRCDEVVGKKIEEAGGHPNWQSLTAHPIYLANAALPESRAPGAPALVVPRVGHPDYDDLKDA